MLIEQKDSKVERNQTQNVKSNIDAIASEVKTKRDLDDVFKELERQADVDADQNRHRYINSFIIFVLLVMAGIGVWKYPEVQAEREIYTEVSQIIEDEGLRLEVYDDTLSNPTIGFGHLVKPGENFGRITPQDAFNLLYEDYMLASQSVDKNYPWASGDVRLVLINMTYQMGPSRLAKFEKTLLYLKNEDYNNAAAELLDSSWASQTPKRAQRLSGRIVRLSKDWW